MPKSTVVDIPPEEPRQILAARRRTRYGDLLALHILLWCAAGRTPPDMAPVLVCSRARVYRTVRAQRAGSLGGEHEAQGRLVPPVRTTVRLPSGRRALLALLKAPPRAYGWCRTPWSCGPLTLTLQRQRGRLVSAETRRRWRHEIGWVWKRAKLVAKDDDPHRVTRLARLRVLLEQLKLSEAMVFADALASHLWPKGGWAWMPNGSHVEVMPPGQNAKHSLAGALDPLTGTLHDCLGARKPKALFRDLLRLLADRQPAEPSTRLDVVGDHDKIHQAKAVEPWLAAHLRVTLLFLPTSCPRANPIERACGDVPDGCTRNHQRKRWPDLVADVEDHLRWNGPWKYKRSDRSYEPAVTTAVESIAAEEQAKVAA